jgi:hypothetical protein
MKIIAIGLYIPGAWEHRGHGILSAKIMREEVTL